MIQCSALDAKLTVTTGISRCKNLDRPNVHTLSSVYLSKLGAGVFSNATPDPVSIVVAINLVHE